MLKVNGWRLQKEENTLDVSFGSEECKKADLWSAILKNSADFVFFVFSWRIVRVLLGWLPLLGFLVLILDVTSADVFSCYQTAAPFQSSCFYCLIFCRPLKSSLQNSTKLLWEITIAVFGICLMILMGFVWVFLKF